MSIIVIGPASQPRDVPAPSQQTTTWTSSPVSLGLAATPGS
jgi:hypothetical protein